MGPSLKFSDSAALTQITDLVTSLQTKWGNNWQNLGLKFLVAEMKSNTSMWNKKWEVTLLGKGGENEPQRMLSGMKT